jgi:DNA-3-methyladenine glycosylase
MHAGTLQEVPRPDLSGEVLTVAPRLLNKLLAVEGRVGRIVEVEAYCGADDPASHAFRGQTPRNRVMFGPAGHLYVYFTYGMHFCCNVVLGPQGTASAALIRAVVPIEGLDEMRRARAAASRDLDLCNGPAKLCQALGIDRADDGTDLCSPTSRVRLCDDGVAPPRRPTRSGRIGIRVATERPWRFCVPGEAGVSRPWPPR